MGMISQGAVAEFNPKMRSAFVESSTTPVTFWVGNNHGASIAKLEPLQ